MIDPKVPLFKWGPIDGKPIYLDAFHEAISDFTAHFPNESWPDMIAYFKDGKILYVIEQSGMNFAGLSFFKDYLAGRKSVQERYKVWQEAAKKIEKEVDSINKGLSNLSDRDLAKKFEHFYDLAIDLWQKEFLAEISNYSGGPYLKEKVFAELPKYGVKVLEKITAPEYRSIFQQEELELLEISLIKDSVQQGKALREHQKKYYWLNNNYGGTEILPVAYFKEKLKGISINEAKEKTRQIKAYPKKVRNDKQVAIKKYKVSKELEKMAEILCATTAWQDQEKKYTLLMDHIIATYLKELSSRCKIPFSDLLYYSLAEIGKLAGGNEPIKVVERQKSCVVHYKEKVGLSWISGDKAEVLVKPYLEEKIDKKSSIIKGMVVSRGKKSAIRAVAKVLLTPKEAAKLNEGEILVAPMTSPEYILAMRKAGAIVTDFGGITSHAAIISRELNIPCIVDTRVATRLIKDGDKILVDTNKGIIKII